MTSGDPLWRCRSGETRPAIDGFVALVEHALGSGDGVAGDAVPPRTSLETLDFGEGPQTFFTIELARDLAAEDFVLTPQVSRDLESWSGEAFIALLREVSNGDGTVNLIYRSAAPVEDETRQFIRILAELQP